MAEPVLPQRATRANAEVLSVDWLFEPHWPGDRLMARVHRGHVTLTERAGQPAPAEFRRAVPILEAGVTSNEALIDGVWTVEPFADEDRPVFVAVDLVELDGEPLREVPFLERRRLLESIIDVGDDLRLSPIVKHPVAGWLDGWRAEGFTHYLAKHQNSGYLAGEENPECLRLSIHPDAPGGIVAGLFGRRRRVRRIRD